MARGLRGCVRRGRSVGRRTSHSPRGASPARRHAPHAPPAAQPHRSACWLPMPLLVDYEVGEAGHAVVAGPSGDRARAPSCSRRTTWTFARRAVSSLGPARRDVRRRPAGPPSRPGVPSGERSNGCFWSLRSCFRRRTSGDARSLRASARSPACLRARWPPSWPGASGGASEGEARSMFARGPPHSRRPIRRLARRWPARPPSAAETWAAIHDAYSRVMRAYWPAPYLGAVTVLQPQGDASGSALDQAGLCSAARGAGRGPSDSGRASVLRHRARAGAGCAPQGKLGRRRGVDAEARGAPSALRAVLLPLGRSWARGPQ